ncbi:hypothetical protein [Deinococcus sp. LM3]|uniref:hypothetical protein n=1 Tax=Deinococcus sp. LM3 TaxID=1938608 RepID=UPI00117C3620|nr:hypothetical protein [Deinococcus sp. LM3]
MLRCLNLAALTDEELQLLVGEDRAVGLLPEISRARLDGRAVAGPPVHEHLTFERLEERAWGSTPEQARSLGSLHAAMLAQGAEFHGTFYLPVISEVRHLRAYTLEPDTTAALRWSETPESARTGRAYLQLMTWLRDRASGVACVRTTGSPTLSSPSLSEEIDQHHHPDASPAELLALHRGYVLRHGRGQKLGVDADWTRAWQASHALNLNAWVRRGLLIDAPVCAPDPAPRPATS